MRELTDRGPTIAAQGVRGFLDVTVPVLSVALRSWPSPRESRLPRQISSFGDADAWGKELPVRYEGTQASGS